MISSQRERCSLKMIVESTRDQWKSKGFFVVKKLTVCLSSKMSQPSMGPRHLGLEHVKSRVKKCATHNAYSHDLDTLDPVDYLYDGYDLNTDIDMIYDNTANTREGMISSDPFH